MQDVSPDLLGCGVFCCWRRFSAYSESPEFDNVNLAAMVAFQLPPLWMSVIHVLHVEQLAIHAVQVYMEVVCEHYRNLSLEILWQGIIFPLDSQ